MKATDQTRPDNNALAKGASTYESDCSTSGNPFNRFSKQPLSCLFVQPISHYMKSETAPHPSGRML